MPFYQIFMRILGEGRPLGVHVVATADRSAPVPTAVSANVSRRIVLRLADENAYALLDAPKDVLDERSAPGRAIVDGFETQIAVLGGTPNVAEQTAAIEQWAEDLRARGRARRRDRRAAHRAAPPPICPTASASSPSSASPTTRSRPRASTRSAPSWWPGRRERQDERDEGDRQSMARFDPGVKLFHFGGRRAQLRTSRPGCAARHHRDAQDLATELAELVADESLTGRIMIVIEDVPQFADSPPSGRSRRSSRR